MQQTIFEFAVAADNNDWVFSWYSLSLSMKLNIPKLQLCVLLECDFSLFLAIIFEYLTTKRG